MIGTNDVIPLVTGGALAAGSTGDKATIAVPFKCEVAMLFVLVTGTSAHATAAVIKFDKRVTAGSDTGRGDGDVGAISKTASLDQQGKYLYERPATRVLLEPGQEVIVEVTTAQGEALTFTAGLLVRESPEDPANIAAMVAA
jgi:hypothetical protein